MAAIINFSHDEVRARMSMADAIDAVRQAFIDLEAGAFELPQRISLASGAFLTMMARHRPSDTSITKTLSLNFEGRDPAILGLVTWSELQSDRVLVADASAVTALRTGAVTGVATDLLAPSNASRCALLGSGSQAADQARAVHLVRPLEELAIVSRNPRNAERLATQLAAELPDTRILVETDVRTAVRARDIVACATVSTAALFECDDLAPNAHVNAIGAYTPAMRELPEALLASAQIVVVDEVEAVLEESGEIIDAVNSGALRRDELRELGSVLTSGFERGAGRTVFKSVGLAVQDWAIAARLAT